MLALAFLSIAAATEHTSPSPADQIPLTRNEIAALFSTLIIEPAPGARHRLRWSTWRRRHQRRAKPATTSGKPPASPDHQIMSRRPDGVLSSQAQMIAAASCGSGVCALPSSSIRTGGRPSGQVTA
jgi:hypothetical protein